MKDWAQYYATLGMSVFPCKPDSKFPATAHGFKDGTTDPARIAELWQSAAVGEDQLLNIGVATGAVSGLVDIETDIKVDPDTGEVTEGEESLADWCSKNGLALPETWSFKSGGGGIHRLFRCENESIPSRTGILPAVDVRANGGYAVFPPSRHPNGNAYEWLPGHAPEDMPDGPVELDFALFSLILARQNQGPLEVPAEIPEGGRNDTLFRLACKLRGMGLSESAILAAIAEVNEESCIPPLEAAEVETLCRSAAKYPAGELTQGVASGDAVNARDLMQKQFSPLFQAVSGLITEGLTLLVAASKIGKSWMALLMAVCIANGEPFLGRQTTKCRVLYLALEDSERRLQERIRTLGLKVPDNLFLKTSVAKMGEGFEEYIEAWLNQDSAPAVVIVDTLQKIRGLDSAGKNAYQADYETAAKLKVQIDAHHGCMICLHHNNKARNVSDPYDKVSGSTALMGAADTTILITRDRGQDTATVMFTGRDVWGEDFTIRFDGGLWSLVSDNAAEYAARQKYEQEPMVQLFRLLLQEEPMGGRWTYQQLIDLSVEKLGFPACSGGKDCVAQLKKDLAKDLCARDGIRVTWGHEFNEGRGVEIRPIYKKG